MTENAVYLDLSKIDSNDVAFLIDIIQEICNDYCMFREGVFDEFMSDEYGEESIAFTLKELEKLYEKISVKPHLDLH